MKIIKESDALYIIYLQAGLILGVSFEIKPLDTFMAKFFPFGTHDIISSISSLGYVLFIFINSVQIDFSVITRTGKRSWIISIIGLGVPLSLGLFAPLILSPEKVKTIEQYSHGIYVALVSHSISSFPVISSLISELQIQNSELGRLSLSSALVSDVLSTIFTTTLTAVRKSHDTKAHLRNLFSLFAFAVLIPLVGRPIMFWIIKHTPEGRQVKDGYIYVIISLVFALGVVSTTMNQDFVLGAFILGLSVPEGPPLGSALVKKLNFFGTTLLLPIFVTTSVLKADFSMDFSSYVMVSIGTVVIVTHLIKIITCFVISLCCKMPVTDALCLSLILNTKGVVEIGIYNGLFDNNVLHLLSF